MIQTFSISPGVNLRCYQDKRFKQGRLSIQLVRPMNREEAAFNALLPTVLLRGSRTKPNLQRITMHLDDLYGATVGDLVRRIGDYQTTGFSCRFTEDRFALPGDEIFRPTVDFLRELLLDPLTENGIFCPAIVETEKRNLIADLESQKNDKALYATNRLMEIMCPQDSYSIPRLGDPTQVAAITPEKLYRHYRKILSESGVEIFYVGCEEPQYVAEQVGAMFRDVNRSYVNLPGQTAYRYSLPAQQQEAMDISQSRLCMSFTTPVTCRDTDYVAMHLFNTLYGSGMTSKLFQNVREKLSLCYSVGSAYYSSKGIVTVTAGIDAEKADTAREEILHQLQLCRDGDITDQELTAAKEAVLSGLQGLTDSPVAIENYFTNAALGGSPSDPVAYSQAVQTVTVPDIARMAATLQPHSEFFLKGVAK